jgi:hypothetical protein
MSETKSEQHEPAASAGVAERCEACGDVFSCGAATGNCWCSEVLLSDDMLASLRERYGHCLCRACLERFAQADSNKDAQDKV